MELELFACVDSNGDYAVGTTSESAVQQYVDDIGDLANVEGFRVVKCVVDVPLPKEIVLRGVAKEEAEATLAVA